MPPNSVTSGLLRTHCRTELLTNIFWSAPRKAKERCSNESQQVVYTVNAPTNREAAGAFEERVSCITAFG